MNCFAAGQLGKRGQILLSSGSTAAKWICKCFAQQSPAQEGIYTEWKDEGFTDRESRRCGQICVISVITSPSQLRLRNESLSGLVELRRPEKAISDPVAQLVSTATSRGQDWSLTEVHWKHQKGKLPTLFRKAKCSVTSFLLFE